MSNKYAGMKAALRALGAACVAVLGAAVLALSWTTATAVQLAATAFVMGGTGHPLSSPEDPVSYINPYLQNAVYGYINPAAEAGNPIGAVGAGDDVYAIITPEGKYPTVDDSVRRGLANLSNCARGSADCRYNDNPAVDPGPPSGAPVAGDQFVILGYSQSAVIASLLKRDLIEDPEDPPAAYSFFLLANPMRPNGGFMARGPKGLTIPLFGLTFYGATPTNSCDTGPCYQTVDYAVQYDILGGDAPVGITNIFALANAMVGYSLWHNNLPTGKFEDAQYQGAYGDTTYYLVTADRIPLLVPFEGFVPSPILTLLDAPLRAVIEAGYARDVNPGVVTRFSLLPFTDPVRDIINIITAIPTGIDDAIAEVSADPDNRPLGTKAVTSPFGVGGPELPEPPAQQGAQLAATAQTSHLAVQRGGDVDATFDAKAAAEKTPAGTAPTHNETADNVPVENALADDALTESDENKRDVKTSAGRKTHQIVRGPIQFESQSEPETPPAAESATTENQAAEPATDEPKPGEAGDTDDASKDAAA